MKKLIPFVSILAMTVAPAAFAHYNDTEQHDQGMKDWVNDYFRQVDTHHYGYITEKEFMAHAKKKFEEMDLNHDGKLTKSEVMRFKENERDEMRHKAETGGINKPEGAHMDRNAPAVSEDEKTNSEDNNR